MANAVLTPSPDSTALTNAPTHPPIPEPYPSLIKNKSIVISLWANLLPINTNIKLLVNLLSKSFAKKICPKQIETNRPSFVYLTTLLRVRYFLIPFFLKGGQERGQLVLDQALVTFRVALLDFFRIYV